MHHLRILLTEIERIIVIIALIYGVRNEHERSFFNTTTSLELFPKQKSPTTK
jgi:hypothetical protein